MEAQDRRLHRILQFWAAVIRSFFYCATAYGIAALITSAAESMAGKTTVADLALEVAGRLEVSVALAWTFGFGGTCYGLWERYLRKKVIRDQAPRLRKLERASDSRRTSSRLNPKNDPPAGV